MSDEESSPGIALQGLVQFLPFGAGSKSESEQPFITCDDGQRFRLHMPGDNPFTNAGLAGCRDKRCVVRGDLDRKRELILVAEIYQEQPVRDAAPDSHPPGADAGESTT